MHLNYDDRVPFPSERERVESSVVLDVSESRTTSRNSLPTDSTKRRRHGVQYFGRPKTRPNSRRRRIRDVSKGTVKFIDTPNTLENIDPRVSRCRPHTTSPQRSEWGRNPEQVMVFGQGPEPLRNVRRVEEGRSWSNRHNREITDRHKTEFSRQDSHYQMNFNTKEKYPLRKGSTLINR